MNDQEAVSHTAASSVDYGASNPVTAETNGSANSQMPKDEIGWYFVEQYYTTLSRNPDKLHVSKYAAWNANVETDPCAQLFYNKRSQHVSGDETDRSEVCVGQKVSLALGGSCNCLTILSRQSTSA